MTTGVWMKPLLVSMDTTASSNDVVIFDKDEAQHASHVRQFLQRCSEKRITLNTEVDFAGFHLSADRYHVDNSIIAEISKFPTPTTRTDLRSFISLVNQLSASTHTVFDLLTPVTTLIEHQEWVPVVFSTWQCLSVCKTVTDLGPPTLSFFDPTKPTQLCTDASCWGLGFVLLTAAIRQGLGSCLSWLPFPVWRRVSMYKS